MSYSLLAYRVSAEKSVDNFMEVPLYVLCYFPLVAFNTVSVCLIFAVWLLCISVCSSLFLSCLKFCASWTLLTNSFPKLQSVALLCCAQSCLTLCNPWTIAHQDPLSTEFSRPEYQSGLPFTIPEDLPDPGIKPVCLLRLLHCWKFPAIISSNIFFRSFSLSSPSRTPTMRMLVHFMLSRCLLCCLHYFFFFFFFSIFYFGAVIPTIMSSMSFICSSASVFCYWFLQCTIHLCLAWSNPALDSTGSMVGLMVTYKRAYAKTHFPGILLPVIPISAGSHCWPTPPQETLQH